MSTVCLYQELDVHSKKRKFDHRHFANNQRRRPRDLDHLAVSQSESFVSPSHSRDTDDYREPVAEDEEPVGAPASAETYYEPSTEREGRYEETPVYDAMAGDPSRMAIARRGKLVTFYRNGDPHYKVSNC